MGKYVMGIDHGGTSTKAVIFDMNGKEITSAKRNIPMQTPKPGHTERDMELLWQMNCAVIRESIERAAIDATEIVGVSFSGHGKGLYLWGKDGQPVRPGIVSTDSRAHAIVEHWYADSTAKAVFPLTCQSILPSQPVALLRWLIENEPGSIEQTRYIFGVKDYVRYRMTGVARGEITDLSGSGLVNLQTADYDPQVLKLLDLECIADKLPELIYSSEFCGAVTKECAVLTGLKPGTRVAAGLFDIDSCAIGMNICDDSRIAVIAGTWSINEYIARKPVLDGSVKMNSLYCLPGYYLAEECSPTSASNYDWFLQQFMGEAAQQANTDIYSLANQMVNQVAPDEQDIIFLPYLYGGCDDARTKATFFGLEAWHSRAHVLRSICEGIVFGHRMLVERLQKSRSVPAIAIRLAGGVVRAEGWVQMFADIMKIPVETIDVDELGALGAAMTAAVAAGEFENLQAAAQSMVHIDRAYTPNPDLASIYDRKYEKYLRVEGEMLKLYGVLNG